MYAIRSYYGIDRDEMIKTLPEIKENAFDPEHRMMATIHRTGDGYLVAVKGAPESVIKSSEVSFRSPEIDFVSIACTTQTPWVG